MVFFNEYTLKKFGLEGDCGICSCTKCSKSCTDCDWIAMHGPINCHDGGIRYCPYMPKPFEKPKGLFDSDKIEDAKRQAEELVFISMDRNDIEKACKDREIKIFRNRIKMESELIKAITEEILKIQ